MDDILAKKNRHLFLEEKDNTSNSFIGNVNDVANRKTELDAVAAHITNVDTVGNNIDNVNTVANNISDINDAVDNIATVKTFNDNINNGTVQYFIEALTTSLDEHGNIWEVRLTQLGESILATTSAFNYSTVVTVSSDIPANGTLILPNSMKYKVGTHMLMVSWNGTICYAGEQYDEVGAYGVWATSITLKQPAKTGDKIQLRIVALTDQSSYVDITEAAMNASQFVASGSNTERYLPEFLGDVVNVKNFGAIGNGVNDDTVAFQSAVATGKAVFIPEGTYKLTTNITGNFCSTDNSTFTGGTINGSTILRGTAQKNNDIVNVKDFGAVGNGINDDTTAFENAVALGKPVFVPEGTYVINTDLSGKFYTFGNVTITGSGDITIRDIVDTVNSLDAEKYTGPFIAQSQTIHVDATNGDDNNNGNTALTAVKTLEKAFKLWNAAKTPQPTLYLHGDHVYETPAVVADSTAGKVEGLLLYTGGAPHIVGVEDTVGGGYPTLKIIFCVTGTTSETVVRTSRHYTTGYNTATSGPRFYTCHVNFSNIAIDSNFNGVYFEGCAVTFNNIDFKVPCRIISSAGDVGNCSFFAEVIEADGQSYKPFGASLCASLYLYHSNIFLNNPTFNVEDGKTIGCSSYLESSARVDGTVTIKPQTATSGSNHIFSVDSSHLILMTGTVSGTATNWTRSINASACSKVFFTNETTYNAWVAVASGVVDSGNGLVHVGTSIVPSGDNLAKNYKTNAVVNVHNGSAAKDGGGIWLYGVSHSSKPGTCTLQATNGSSYYAFDVRAGDIRLQNTFTKFWADTTVALGDDSKRWGQLFTTTAPNTSSDERLKQQIGSIPDEVLKAWEEVQWKQFKFNDAVKNKGNNARLHTGLIAQNINTIFKNHNIDISKYGLFCHGVWESKPEEIDEYGNVISPAKPAGDEYSIRYEEALALECAYLRNKIKEQNTKIEALMQRISALENSH